MEFQRFVSYVYEYHGREKGENCGFVKAEVRREQVRLLVHMYLPRKQGVEYQVYGCLRRGGHVDGILLGKGSIKNGNVDIRLQIPEEDMTVLYRGEDGYAGAGIPFGELSGIIVQASDKQVYGTVWDEEELDVMAFSEWKPHEAEPEQVQAKEQIEEVSQENQESKLVQEEGELGEDREGEVAKDVRDWEAREEDVRMEETDSQMNIQEVKHESPIRQKLREQCVAMAPFEAQPDGEFFRIEPRHLGILPKNCWQLGRNSFLLHGYYNYRYLIVGEEENCVLIGVPGTYSFMEEACAAMFGFVLFYPAQGGHKEHGRFGYWCRRIPLPEEDKAADGVTHG